MNAPTHRPVPATTPVSAMDHPRRMIIKSKVVVIGRLSRHLAVLRANEDAVNEIKQTSTTGKLPVGALTYAVHHQQNLQVST
ncbi:hypothetical protein BX666DRAFT_2004498 [Dichotomocladium elegans]|nr:hypothetical protein BX666DRAFT_2004498 [Dichotomocladium elegans]